MENGVYRLTVGQPSPFSLAVPASGFTAKLVVDAAATILAVAVGSPTVADLLALATGQIAVALDHERTSAFLVECVRVPLGLTITCDTPLHVGLEDITDFPTLSLAGLPPDETRAVVVLVQDETTTIRSMRLIALPRQVLVPLAHLVDRQLAERHRPGLEEYHRESTRRYHARTGSATKAFDQATIKASVA